MPSFVFTARDGSGRPQNGTLSADSSGELVSQLRGRGWIVLDVQADTAANKGASLESINPVNWLPATKLDVELGMQQIASMLRSGLTLLSSIKTASEQVRRPAMGKIWRNIYERIEEGSSFADALARHPACFPEYIVQLVRVGEQSGTLETVLVRGAEQLERSRDLKITLLNALMYPAIVVIMAVGVSGFMLLSVIPKIQKFLSSSGRRLPPITQALMDISGWVRQYGLTLALVALAVVAGLMISYRFPPARLAMDAFILRVPLIGKLLRLAATAAFSRSLGLLLESGITLLEALRTVEKLMGNRALSVHIAAVRESVMQGGPLAAPLAAKGLFMPMLSRRLF